MIHQLVLPYPFYLALILYIIQLFLYYCIISFQILFNEFRNKLYSKLSDSIKNDKASSFLNAYKFRIMQKSVAYNNCII